MRVLNLRGAPAMSVHPSNRPRGVRQARRAQVQVFVGVVAAQNFQCATGDVLDKPLGLVSVLPAVPSSGVAERRDEQRLAVEVPSAGRCTVPAQMSSLAVDRALCWQLATARGSYVKSAYGAGAAQPAAPLARSSSSAASIAPRCVLVKMLGQY